MSRGVASRGMRQPFFPVFGGGLDCSGAVVLSWRAVASGQYDLSDLRLLVTAIRMRHGLLPALSELEKERVFNARVSYGMEIVLRRLNDRA